MNKSEMFIRDIALHGLRADLMPTMDCADAAALYVEFTRYLRRVDDSIRDRASGAIAAASDFTARLEKAEAYAREMERQRNAFGEALTRIANGEAPAASAMEAMQSLTSGDTNGESDAP